MNSKHVPYPRIGTYRLIEAYATQGRSGVVWKAEDKTGAKVVIKAPDFNELPAVLAKQRKEIATEIEVLERLQEFSPPVISLLYKDMVQHAGEYYPYAVLEQLDESQNLYHIILNDYQRYSVLPVLELLDIFHWMLTVLDHAHKVGIVYNDVDMKHIFWSRVLEASVFRDEARRIRVIDWANSFFSTDLADQQKDIHQAGELLHDIFSVVHTKPLEATQKYTSDIRQLLEDIQGGVFTSIADLISAVDRFRYDVQRVFHLLLGDIDKQIRQAIDADFDQVNGLIEKAQNLYREYHYCDQIFWQTWDSWHELIIERVVLQIKQLIGLGQYAIIDELINYLQHQINQLADTYDGTSRDSLIRLSDFMRLSVRIIRRIQDTTNSAQKETQVSAISDTWSNLLPPTNRLEFSRLIHNILIHANGLIFEDWRDLCHAAYLFAYIYDVPEQDWPLDIRLIRYLFKGDPSGEILDENAQRCVIDYHNRMLSSDSFLFALEESIQGQNFDHHITSLLNYVREELRQELEQLPLTSKAFADVDYWHRDLITKSQNQLRHLAAQYRHLRRVHFFSERSNKWYEVQSLEHFDAWIVSYASFLQNWNTCGKDTGILDQWLRQAKKSFEGLIDALHMGHVGQAKTHYSELTLSLDILTDTGHDWLDSKLPKKILDVKGPEQTIELWQSQLAPSRNPIRDVCINVLNITLRIDEYRSFELERECRRKLERSYEEINKLIETHSENQQLGNLVKILRSIIGGVLDPASTSFGPDRQIWDQVPQSSFRESAQKYLHTRELGNQLAQVQTLEQATELFSRLSPERVEPNSQIGDSHHSIIATLKPITDVKTRWENGDFAYHKELSRLRTKLETDPWFQKSAILELATIMHHNFQHAQEIIEEIKEMRTQLLSWLTNRHSQQLSITSSEYQVPQSTIVDDIIDKYDKIIQIGNQFYNESNSIHEWRNYLRSYVDLVSTPNMIQMPQAKENDPLIGVYTTFNKLLPKQRPSRYKRLSIIAAFLAGISAVLLILFLIIYFNRESIQELISIDSALIANETATDLSSFTIVRQSRTYTPINHTLQET